MSIIKVISGEKAKLLGIYIDNRLNFDYHISQHCKNAGKKVHALNRVFKYEQHKLIGNVFIMFLFTYCPLIWMFHSRAMEHKIMKGLLDLFIQIKFN